MLPTPSNWPNILYRDYILNIWNQSGLSQLRNKLRQKTKTVRAVDRKFHSEEVILVRMRIGGIWLSHYHLEHIYTHVLFETLWTESPVPQIFHVSTIQISFLQGFNTISQLPGHNLLSTIRSNPSSRLITQASEPSWSARRTTIALNMAAVFCIVCGSKC